MQTRTNAPIEPTKSQYFSLRHTCKLGGLRKQPTAYLIVTSTTFMFFFYFYELHYDLCSTQKKKKKLNPVDGDSRTGKMRKGRSTSHKILSERFYSFSRVRSNSVNIWIRMWTLKGFPLALRSNQGERSSTMLLYMLI